MKALHIKKITQSLLVSWLLWSCAQPRLPTGGLKDTIPPHLLYSIPDSGALNYSKKSITLAFDEWIGENNLRSKLLITPQFEERNPYKVRIRKNKLEINFEHALDSNKTYTISLEEGITDLTERNLVQGLQIAFSTGPYIDTLSLFGEVHWAKKNEPVDQAVIYLVSGEEDSLHFTEREPIYINRSNKEGGFKFVHLSPGAYRLFAFIDENKNQALNLETEAYAFIADTIHLTQPVKEKQQLALVQLDGSSFKCIGGRTQNNYFEVFYNKILNKYRVRHPTDTFSLPYSYITKKEKSIRFYKNAFFKTPEDSLEIYIEAQDQQKNQRLDTFHISFDKQAFIKKEKKNNNWFNIKAEDLQKEVYSSDSFALKLLFPLPIKSYTLDSISYLYQDSLRRNISEQQFSWNHNFTQLNLADSVPTIDQFSIEIRATAFINVLGDSSKYYKKTYKAIDPQLYGRISGTVVSSVSNYILELIDSNAQPLRSLHNPKTFFFDHISEGSYRFRYTEDHNQNGSWDAGHILNNISPEPIYISDTTFVIKANWTLEDIKLRF